MPVLCFSHDHDNLGTLNGNLAARLHGPACPAGALLHACGHDMVYSHLHVMQNRDFCVTCALWLELRHWLCLALPVPRAF